MNLTKENLSNKMLFELSSPKIVDLLGKDLHHFLSQQEFPWRCLGSALKDFIQALLMSKTTIDRHKGNISDKCHLINPESIYVGAGAVIEPFALVEGPAWIANGAVVRHGAYIRGNVYVGENSIVGHTTEAKGSILLPNAKAAHFAYLGDSILGVDVNLGAGTKCANLRLDHGQVKLRAGNERLETGLKKMGAIFGNRAQTGCNTVTNPGTILLADSFLLPNSTGLGVIRPKPL